MIIFPHKNLGELAIKTKWLYIGLTLPHREGWGSWGVRLYWHWKGGIRHWLLLPQGYYRKDRVAEHLMEVLP